MNYYNVNHDLITIAMYIHWYMCIRVSIYREMRKEMRAEAAKGK